MRWRGKKLCYIVHGRPFLNNNSNARTLHDPHYRTPSPPYHIRVVPCLKWRKSPFARFSPLLLVAKPY